MKQLIATVALFAAIAIANAGIWICQWTDVSSTEGCKNLATCEESAECNHFTWQEGNCGLGLASQCYQKDKGTVVVTWVRRHCKAVNGSSGTECACEGELLQQGHYYGEAPTCSYYPDPVE